MNDSGESYTLYTMSGVDRSHFDKFPMPRNTHVFGPTFRGEGVVRSDDITKDPRYGKNPPYSVCRRAISPSSATLRFPSSAAPEKSSAASSSVIPRPAASSNAERLMEGIAAQAAIAIDKAQLYRAAQHEIEQRVKAEQALSALNETLESRVAEEIARRAQAEEVLRHAQKMEAVGQLTGGIAHDFNNLLQSSSAISTLLQRRFRRTNRGGEAVRRQCAHRRGARRRADAAAARFLAPPAARPEAGRRQRLDRRHVELLHRTLGETDRDRDALAGRYPGRALVDGNQLENAILNLAINARDAMPEGGS